MVVLATQWRAHATGYAGDPNAATPHLDRLAAQGLDLYQAVTPHPFGVFARAAFLTGLPCPRNGVRDYYDPLPENTRTLAGRFSDTGYETAYFGKWQLYKRDPADPVVGEAHARIHVPETWRGGFDFWEGFESGFLLNDPILHGTDIGEPTRFPGYQSEVIVSRFLRWLGERTTKKPFFSILSLDAPHPPYADSAAGLPPPDPASLILRDNVPDEEPMRSRARKELSGYYAHISATDAALGRLARELARIGVWDNTLFVFTSVHGDMHGSEGKFRKGWPYEESVRVPMLLSWPNAIALPRRDPALISLIDLGPTLLAMAGGSRAPWFPDEDCGKDLSERLFLREEGPKTQQLSMPSVPPFGEQCPYVWNAQRTAMETVVEIEGKEPFRARHVAALA